MRAYGPIMLPYRQGFMHGFADMLSAEQELEYSQIIAEAYRAVREAHDGLSSRQLGHFWLGYRHGQERAEQSGRCSIAGS